MNLNGLKILKNGQREYTGECKMLKIYNISIASF